MKGVREPALVTAAAAVVLAALASRVGDWAVMTDELLYERLALSLVDGGLPRLRGELVDTYALLYPLVLAPVFVLFSMPTAIVAAHAWNGVLFASAALPAYLLARRLGVPALAAASSAIFAVVLPWSVITGFVMTENAAYPAFLWAVLAIQRAAVDPGDRPYLLALGGIALAALARPQLAVLGLVLPLAAGLEELRVRRGLRAHRVVVGVYGVALLFAVVLGLTGSLGAALGSYAPTIEEGSLLSRAAIRSAIVHLDVVAVATGIVPLLVGGGWAAEAIVRPPRDPERRTFAVVVFATVALLSVQVGSFVVRFALGIDVKDRYLFYVAPLLFVATAVALAEARARIAGLLAVTATFVLTVGLEEFEPVFGVNVDSPAAAVHELLTRVLDDPATWLAVAAGLIAVALVIALRAAPRAPVAAVVLGGTTLLCALETGYAWDRLLDSSGPSARPLTESPAQERSWVDNALGAGDDAGMLPYSVGHEWFPSAIAWWDVEFWNAQVTRSYLVGDRFTYAPEPFPHDRLRVDLATGRIVGTLRHHLVRSTLDARFAPVGVTVATAPELELVRVERPPRARWATLGLDPDGWTRRDKPAALRVYGEGETVVTLTLNSPDVDEPRGYDLGGARVGYLGSTETRKLQFTVCGRVDVPLRVLGASTERGIPDGPPHAESFREVGLRLTRVSALPTGRSC